MSSVPPSAQTRIPESIQIAPRRPIGVTMFAILSILFGVLGFMGSSLSLLITVVGGLFDAGVNPLQELVSDNVAYRIFYVTLLVLGLVFSVVAAVAGFGLLKMSGGARKLIIAYGVASIVATVAAKAVDLFVVYLPMIEELSQQSEEQQIATVVMIGVAIIFAMISLIFPIAILIYFLRPSVKQSFLNWPSTAGG